MGQTPDKYQHFYHKNNRSRVQTEHFAGSSLSNITEVLVCHFNYLRNEKVCNQITVLGSSADMSDTVV